MSEEIRYRIADQTVNYLLRYGRWPELNDRPELRPLANGSSDKRP
jgi:hypothetical protein